MAKPLTKEIHVSTYNVETKKEKKHKVTIRELLGGEKRAQRMSGPDAKPIYTDETLVDVGIGQEIVDAMPCSEQERVMAEIWTLSGFPPLDDKEGDDEGN